MNWANALLTVAILSGAATFFVGMYQVVEGDETSKRWLTALFIITAISGALAAGLWK